MTQHPSNSDVLERRLSQSFTAAHDDPRWAGDVWTDQIGRLQRVRRARTRRVWTISAVAAVGVVAAGVAGFSMLSASSDRVQVVGPADQSDARTGLDWLLTKSQYFDYAAAHPSPSPATN